MSLNYRSIKNHRNLTEALFTKFYMSLDVIGKDTLKRCIKSFINDSNQVSAKYKEYNYAIAKISEYDYIISFIVDGYIEIHVFTIHEINETIKKIEGV